MAAQEISQFTDPGRAPRGCTSDPLVRALARTRRQYHNAVRREDGSAAARYEAQYDALARRRRAYLLRQAASKEER